MVSQNAAFSGAAAPHEDDTWAPGHSLALLIRDRLTADGWEVSEPEAWRGSGWFVECRSRGERLDVSLTATADSGWILQIAPSDIPSWLGRLRGKVASATPGATHALARAVHVVIASQGDYSGLRWCWDGDPRGASATLEPPAPVRPR